MNATFETIDEQPRLCFERRIAHPIESVWQAITDPAELEHWFPTDVEVDLRVGGAMTFTFANQPLAEGPMTMTGEVTELDPPRKFAFLWGEDHLHFALEPIDDGAGCMMRFTVELDARDKAARDGAGWHVCLDVLERRLSGVQTIRPHQSDEWRARYEEYQRRGFPGGASLPAD